MAWRDSVSPEADNQHSSVIGVIRSLTDIDGDSVTIAAATTGDAAEVSALLAELGYPIGIDDAAHRLEWLAATGNDPVFLFRREGQALGLLSRWLCTTRSVRSPRPDGLLRSAQTRRTDGRDASIRTKLTGPTPQMAITAGSFAPRITPS